MDRSRNKLGDFKKDVLRDEDVMEWLGISKNSLARLRKSGALPSFQLGASHFYLRKEAMKVFKKKMAESSSPKPPSPKNSDKKNGGN